MQFFEITESAIDRIFEWEERCQVYVVEKRSVVKDSRERGILGMFFFTTAASPPIVVAGAAVLGLLIRVLGKCGNNLSLIGRSDY